MSDKILIVDDEPEIADLMEVYLKNENYEVYKFYTAREALACIHTNGFSHLGSYVAGYRWPCIVPEDQG